MNFSYYYVRNVPHFWDPGREVGESFWPASAMELRPFFPIGRLSGCFTEVSQGKARRLLLLLFCFGINLVALWRKLRQSGPEPAFWKAQGLCCGTLTDARHTVLESQLAGNMGARASWPDWPFCLTKDCT